MAPGRPMFQALSSPVWPLCLNFCLNAWTSQGAGTLGKHSGYHKSDRRLFETVACCDPKHPGLRVVRHLLARKLSAPALSERPLLAGCL